MSTLSAAALQCVDNYFSLPFTGTPGVRCPYFNNARVGQRGQLRALIGKGSPQEIVDEAFILAKQYCKGLFETDGACCNKLEDHNRAECVRRFLIDHNIGIDCSGFIIHVLQKHFEETNQMNIVKKLYITSTAHPFRWLMSRFRPIENIDVSVFAGSRNTAPVRNIADLQPGDLIVMLKTGPNNNRNHLLLITEKRATILHYVHARAWSSEGQYGHGVSKGQITITDPGSDLLHQEWLENGTSDYKNETYMEAKNAQILEMRRINF